jgi:uncharacterized membrane protein YoaK (UPF0700 family)
MKDTLPRWAVFGGFALAAAAGCMNGFVLLHGLQPASHLTGTLTALGLALTGFQQGDVIYLFSILCSFFVGSAISGMIVRDYHLKLGRRYGVALCIETLVILTAMVVLDWHHAPGVCLIAFACGLQNAMVTTYSGAALRTTHVTGLITDIGVLLGHRLAGLRVERKRVLIQSSLVGGFLCGALVCGLFIRVMGRYVMIIPACITGCAGGSYFIYRKRNILIN